MAVKDFLKKIGEGTEKVGRVAGDVLEPVARRTAEVLSGEAPEIDAQKRQNEEKSLDARAQDLEAQLETGRKYGTLTGEQQKQYVDAIAQLYSHPSQMGTLVEKLHKAVHPDGAAYQPYTAPLANATPEGGTAAVDEATRQRVLADTIGLRQNATDEEIDRRARQSTMGKKSPPLPGNQLPPEAVDVNGQPIPAAARDAQHSFINYQGAWWPVAKPKPVFKTIKGHSVLVDSQTGAFLRDLGPVGTAKVTTRQTLQPGDDGQMHLVNLTSVTTPEGAQIEVEPESGEAPVGGGGSTPTPAAAPPKPKVGAILPKTGAQPVAPSSGPVVPGLHSLAQSKNPLFKADAASYKKANDDAIQKQESYTRAQGLLADNSRQTDLELIFSWVRSNVQGAGRMTNTEIQQAAGAGSWGMRVKNAIEQASTGRLAPEMEQQFLSDIKRSAEVSKQTADGLRKQLDTTATPGGGGQDENWVRDPATGKLVKQ